MPAPADNRRATETPGPARWRREFRDALERPLSGSVVFYPRLADGVRVVAISPTTVNIVDGVADVALPPGDYTVAERLVGADGVEVPFTGSYMVTIT
jgi:hypothetical protein